jgi:transcriptional regulator
VPTWNYVVVHAHGPLRAIEDRGWLRGFEGLTNRHEASRSHPWKVTDAPADYLDKQVGAIVGLEMPLTRLVGKWKMSQNRTARDQDGVVEGLLQEGRESATAMAGWIRQSRNR